MVDNLRFALLQINGNSNAIRAIQLSSAKKEKHVNDRLNEIYEYNREQIEKFEHKLRDSIEKINEQLSKTQQNISTKLQTGSNEARTEISKVQTMLQAKYMDGEAIKELVT